MPIRQFGLSLVEVMLALLIGSLLMIGASQLFGSSGGAYRLTLTQLHVQESAGFALRQIARHLQSAGGFGCAQLKLNNLRAGWSNIFEFNIQVPLQVVSHKQLLQGDWKAELPISKPVDNGLTYISRRGLNSRFYQPGRPVKSGLLAENSDILVTRQSGPPFFRLASSQAGDAPLSILLEDGNQDGRLTLADIDNFGFPRGRAPIVMVGDCRHQVIFRVTGVNLAGNRAFLRHQAGGSGSAFENKQNALLPAGESFAADAYVSAVETHVFYVATGAGSQPQSPILSLWHKQGVQRPLELVEGIEQLRLFAGLDTDGDGLVDQYSGISKATDLSLVKTLRLVLLAGEVDARSNQPAFRQAFVQTVHLRNL